jgi:spore germination cell wall hydrolase CwlJ-like protein
MIHDDQDIANLALVAWKEARGEGFEGCRAVMHVIINRVGFPGFAYTLHDVIYGKNQFTSMSVTSDPEYNLSPGPGDGVYNSCKELAKIILNGGDPDSTNGAHYYANLKYTTSGWFFNHIVNNPTEHPQVGVIGHHTFFK